VNLACHGDIDRLKAPGRAQQELSSITNTALVEGDLPA
jgi:hypothetical protein